MVSITVSRRSQVAQTDSGVKGLARLRARLQRRLAENRRRMVVPWSFRQIARLRGCAPASITLALQGKRRSPAILADLTRIAAGRSIARRNGRVA